MQLLGQQISFIFAQNISSKKSNSIHYNITNQVVTSKYR